jgi:hypothetical protein
MMWTEDFTGQYLGKPTLVTTLFSEVTVIKQNKGPEMAVGPSEPSDFWEYT